MMIKINLLPSEKVGPKRAYTQIALMVVMLLMTGVVIGYFWVDLNNTIAEKKKDIDEKKRIVKQLEQTIRKVEELEDKRRTIKSKLDIITNAKKFQLLPVRIMSGFLNIIPEDVWLVNLRIEGGLTMSGYALSYNTVGNFMTAIDTSQYFQDAVLESAVKNIVNGREVIFFRMRFNLNLPGIQEGL